MAKPPSSIPLTTAAARHLWLHAQRLDSAEPFGAEAEATRLAVEHLGYVQIDTINVIERSHHHILYSRIPAYRREHLVEAQSRDKSVFEYWTHALAYVPTRDIGFFLDAMKRYREAPSAWFGMVTPAELKKAIARVRREGPLSIRDIDDDVLVEKHHPWASRKPSKRALQLAFYGGTVTISAREGMLKTYDLIERHFGWDKRPRPATERQRIAYLLDRALRAQGLVSLDSICYLDAPSKKPVRELIEARVKRKQLVPVHLENMPQAQHWITPEALETVPDTPPGLVHILSPFDPLIIQRKRLSAFFGYDHLFEAYLPQAKRKLGYFALPVLVGDRIVAAIDLKADRAARTLLVQNWTWVADVSQAERIAIDEALHRFEAFQFAATPALS